MQRYAFKFYFQAFICYDFEANVIVAITQNLRVRGKMAKFAAIFHQFICL